MPKLEIPKGERHLYIYTSRPFCTSPAMKTSKAVRLANKVVLSVTTLTRPFILDASRLPRRNSRSTLGRVTNFLQSMSWYIIFNPLPLISTLVGPVHWKSCIPRIWRRPNESQYGLFSKTICTICAWTSVACGCRGSIEYNSWYLMLVINHPHLAGIQKQNEKNCSILCPDSSLSTKPTPTIYWRLPCFDLNSRKGKILYTGKLLIQPFPRLILLSDCLMPAKLWYSGNKGCSRHGFRQGVIKRTHKNGRGIWNGEDYVDCPKKWAVICCSHENSPWALCLANKKATAFYKGIGCVVFRFVPSIQAVDSVVGKL